MLEPDTKLKELKNNFFQHLFEDAILNEINQIGTFKEVSKDFEVMEFGEDVKSNLFDIQNTVFDLIDEKQ